MSWREKDRRYRKVIVSFEDASGRAWQKDVISGGLTRSERSFKPSAGENLASWITFLTNDGQRVPKWIARRFEDLEEEDEADLELDGGDAAVSARQVEE